MRTTALFLVATGGYCVAEQPVLAPRFVVDLDLPAANRWDVAVEGLVGMYGFDGTFGKIVDYITDLVPEPIITALEPVLEGLAGHFAG
eukprot:CAMPEP_0119518078 /NCGR_PEP_ID=MMETSP1344-20130328/34788_1 /TAXON_ID=236787 /ORGANISM="Florenciella parvula, Strain CCMP2471" /LENGTH=87 /DNA_ID=CAMNT_0007555725 /DNA_START=41 /DNA_END=301 /DNA_ORIENTATION=-